MIEIENSKTSPAIIKVVGVGGCGCNAVNRMIEKGITGIDFIAINTDEQALNTSLAPIKIVLGKKVTNGLGAGGNPEIGLKSAKEDRDKIVQVLEGADMVFVTAGMGGGTGTGASPIVAEVARSLGALTVSVVTIPFEVEGKVRKNYAEMGIKALREHVDTLIVINNQQVFKVVKPDTPIVVALKIIDDVLFNALKGISDIINKPGIINVDFADVKKIMTQSGEAVLGFGKGVGENKVIEAANQALNNLLLENSDITGASGILINICGGPQLTLQAWNEVSELITREVDKDANKIIGLTIDNSLEDEVYVILIATGLQKRKDKKINTTNDYSIILKNNNKNIHSNLSSYKDYNNDSVEENTIPYFPQKERIHTIENTVKIKKEPYPIHKEMHIEKNNPTESSYIRKGSFPEFKNGFKDEHFNEDTMNWETEYSIQNNYKHSRKSNFNIKEKEEIVQPLREILERESYRSSEENIFHINFQELEVPAYLRRKR